jgi:hypothetical protein
MTAYLEAVKRWPDARYFGGAIRPWFGAGVPRWVKRNSTALASMLCLRDLGPVGRRFQAGEFPYGPNMAVRREALALASFDERVGRKGPEQMRYSETSLFLTLEQLGVPGVWVPAAKVCHHIPRSRANFKYFWDYYRSLGRSAVRLGIAGGPRSRWRLWAAGLRALTQICVRPGDWHRHLAGLAFMSGRQSESRLLARRCNASEFNGVER